MITDLGRQYICANFGNTSLCCCLSGLGWYYTVGGQDYPETGGTAQIVSRLASGLIDSLTMTNPARGAFTQAELNAANGQSVTLQDAQTITQHDEPSEDQWCFVPCEEHMTKQDCEYYGCFWYNGSCHTNPPVCEELNNEPDCTIYGCYWYNGSCHSVAPTCEDYNNEYECITDGCYWYNGQCHSTLDCNIINNQTDCLANGCFWYQGACHGIDQPGLCYWIDSKGGPSGIQITDVFEIIDSYIYQSPPQGYGFIPSIIEVFGVIDYYLGFDGDDKTGCNYFG